MALDLEQAEGDYYPEGREPETSPDHRPDSDPAGIPIWYQFDPGYDRHPEDEWQPIRRLR